ncbi:MAG: hypothetical protein ACTSPB_01195 [Candidatus Thorarchaeota archaeon]
MAVIETYLGSLEITGLREDSLGFHVFTGSEKEGNARSWMVSEEDYEAFKTQMDEVEPDKSVFFANHSHCWFCGRKISKPKLLVKEGMYSYGSFVGYKVTGVIHASCAEKAEEEYKGYQFKVVEA